MLYPAELRARRKSLTPIQLGDGGLERRGWGGVVGLGEEGDGLDDVEAGAAEELVDDGAGEAAGVVLDADGLRGLIDGEVADAVDVAHLGECEDGLFGGRGAVAVEDIKLGHGVILASGGGYSLLR